MSNTVSAERRIQRPVVQSIVSLTTSLRRQLVKYIQTIIILIPTPDFPLFYYNLGGGLGTLLYGDVSVRYRYSKYIKHIH